jgi:hydrogenase expression/formation protein HypC
VCLAIPGRIVEVIDEDEAAATRRLLEQMGAEYEQELEELKASAIE